MRAYDGSAITSASEFVLRWILTVIWLLSAALKSNFFLYVDGPSFLQSVAVAFDLFVSWAWMRGEYSIAHLITIGLLLSFAAFGAVHPQIENCHCLGLLRLDEGLRLSFIAVVAMAATAMIIVAPGRYVRTTAAVASDRMRMQRTLKLCFSAHLLASAILLTMAVGAMTTSIERPG